MLARVSLGFRGEKAKSHVAIQFKDAKGVELYELTLRLKKSSICDVFLAFASR